MITFLKILILIKEKKTHKYFVRLDINKDCAHYKHIIYYNLKNNVYLNFLKSRIILYLFIHNTRRNNKNTDFN